MSMVFVDRDLSIKTIIASNVSKLKGQLNHQFWFSLNYFQKKRTNNKFIASNLFDIFYASLYIILIKVNANALMDIT